MTEIFSATLDFGVISVVDDADIVVVRAYNIDGDIMSETEVLRRPTAKSTNKSLEINDYDAVGSIIKIANRLVCNEYSVKLADVISQKRSQRPTLARHVAQWIIHDFTPLSLEDIGEIYSGRDHSTILHALQRVEKKMEYDRRFASTANRLKDQVEQIIHRRPSVHPA